MNMIDLRVGIFALLFLTGCRAGPMIHELLEPKTPFGAHVEIKVSQDGTAKKHLYNGELIEARDDGLIIALDPPESEPSRITFVPWPRIFSVKATELPGFRANGARNPSDNSAAAEKMRIISRFPQGLSPELMEKLLSSFNQKNADPLP